MLQRDYKFIVRKIYINQMQIKEGKDYFIILDLQIQGKLKWNVFKNIFFNAV
jgi:hypothetical protein